jgi:acetyl-CoA C-acetyltransferase
MSRVPMGIDGSTLLMEPNAAFGHFVPQGFCRFNSNKIWIFPKRCRWLLNSQNELHLRNKMAFDKSIIPVTDINGLVHLAKDEYIRANTTLEILSKLSPAFEKWANNYLISHRSI